LPISKVKEQAMQLQVEYQEALGFSFSNECIHFRSHLSGLKDNNLTIIVLELYKIFKDFNISSLYPYIEIALLCMLLCSPVSNCSAEQSFSALNIIKSCLRSTIDNVRLNSLAVQSIESEITRNDTKYKK
jgi:hypothetical protein